MTLELISIFFSFISIFIVSVLFAATPVFLQFIRKKLHDWIVGSCFMSRMRKKIFAAALTLVSIVYNKCICSATGAMRVQFDQLWFLKKYARCKFLHNMQCISACSYRVRVWHELYSSVDAVAVLPNQQRRIGHY